MGQGRHVEPGQVGGDSTMHGECRITALCVRHSGTTRARQTVAGLVVVAVNRMPAADVEVSADLVRRLLAAQHLDLARLPVEFLANGWDNELYRVGDELVARLPRRAPGAQIIKNEQRWLPGLAARLPLPVPYPERTGVPGCGYPYSWSVVPYLPGVPAALAGSFDAGRAAAAVGGFLGALHVPAPADAPANPFRGVPLAERASTFAANLALLTGHVDRDAVLREWVAALATRGHDGPPVWLHGDLHPVNILVDDGQVSGVIDFGDITSGDPASDLAVAWMLLPPGCHPGFWSAYQAAGGQGGDALRARAKGWALNFAIVFLAHSQDNPVLREVGRRTLRTVLADRPGLCHGWKRWRSAGRRSSKAAMTTCARNWPAIFPTGTRRQCAADRPCGYACRTATRPRSRRRPCVSASRCCQETGLTHRAEAGSICACTSSPPPAT